MMIFLSEDAMIYLKRRCVRHCIFLIANFACIYVLGKRVVEQEIEIENLTKKFEELKLKGD